MLRGTWDLPGVGVCAKSLQSCPILWAFPMDLMDLPRPGVKPLSPSLAGGFFFFTAESPGKSPPPAFYNTNSPKFHPFLKWADSAGKTKKPETQGTEAGMQNHKVVPKPQLPTDSQLPLPSLRKMQRNPGNPSSASALCLICPL